MSLPQLPEMTFGKNTIEIKNQQSHFAIDFNALDALRMVDNQKDDLKVAASGIWKESRYSHFDFMIIFIL